MSTPVKRTIHVYPLKGRKHAMRGVCWCDPEVERCEKRGARPRVRAWYIVKHSTRKAA